MSETASLQDALAAAEAELDTIAARAKEAYRKYQELNDVQTAKADEVRELRRQIREERTL